MRLRRLLLASSARKAWLRAQSRGGRLDFDEPVYFGPGCAFSVEPGAALALGPRVHFRRNCVLEVNGTGRVQIGADSQFTYHCVVQCSTSITIGERCTVAAGALIVDGNHRFRDLAVPVREQGYDYRPLTIGDDVWIGAGAVVMADVGDRAVIGANAVVVDPVAPFSVVGGVPAKLISDFSPSA